MKCELYFRVVKCCLHELISCCSRRVVWYGFCVYTYNSEFPIIHPHGNTLKSMFLQRNSYKTYVKDKVHTQTYMYKLIRTQMYSGSSNAREPVIILYIEPTCIQWFQPIYVRVCAHRLSPHIMWTCRTYSISSDSYSFLNGSTWRRM